MQDKTIFDIVLYGSAAKGKISPNDVDIAIIFREGTLKERLAKIQTIKKRISIEQKEKIDMKGILWEELFKESFFARSGILVDGISLLDGKPFAQKIGFISYSIFIYTLQNKSHTEKIKFNYILSGRKSKGMIALLEGKRLASGVIQIPTQHSLEFEDVLKKQNVTYSILHVLVQR